MIVYGKDYDDDTGAVVHDPTADDRTETASSAPGTGASGCRTRPSSLAA